jgi:hypothetical protein
MTGSWLLIVHLLSGGITVNMLPDMRTCLMASSVAIQYSDVKKSSCVLYTGWEI